MGVAKVKEFEDFLVVGAGYIRATYDRRQHWHLDCP